MRNIAALAVLVLALGSAQGIPQEQQVPDDLDVIQQVQDNSCLRKAWEHYEQVLATTIDRADHFYLAETYRAMGEHNLNCGP